MVLETLALQDSGAVEAEPGDMRQNVEPPTAKQSSRSGPVSPSNLAVAALALTTAACGGGGTSSGTPPGPGSTAQARKPQSDAEAAQFILRASLSVSTAEIANIKSVGFEPWLDAQIGAQIGQTGIAWLASRGFDQVTAANYFDNEYPGDYMIWNQLMTGSNGVRKRIALALSEYFVVSLTGLNFAWRSQAIAHYWDQLNARAFGNFRELLEDITLNPAMGYFLNTQGNRKEDTRTGRQPDENYAREVMQLFTIGLYQLNGDGTPKAGANGQPTETYTNDDVTNLARVFTGYDWDFTGNVDTLAVGSTTRKIPGTGYVTKAMTSDFTKWRSPPSSSQHSALAATFLGTSVPANTDATAALKIALDALFNHSNVGPFFARQMIQRLVTSNPSAAYVTRVANVFNNNGTGQRGDLRAVFKAILLDDEALAPATRTDPRFGKIREPMVRLVQWGRTFGALSTSGNWNIGNVSDSASRLGQSPLRSPSVFNFFRPGYVPSNTMASANGLVAPEFQLVNETSTSGYVNYMTTAIGSANGINNDVKAQYSAELAIAPDAAALVDHVSLLMAAAQLSDSTKAVIRQAVEDVVVTASSPDSEKLRRVYLAVLLVMASAEYLVQK